MVLFLILSRFARIDWDLEVLGIEIYYSRWIKQGDIVTPGVVDLIESYANDSNLDWRQCLLAVLPPEAETIQILPAGKDLANPTGDREYVTRLRGIKWAELFETKRLGNFLEDLRNEWREEYDFVLIDSRTGITDIGGICQMFRTLRK